MSVEIRIDVAASQLSQALKAFPKDCAAGIRWAMDTQNSYTLGVIQRNHLTTRGATSTQTQTGKLRSSAYATKATGSESNIESSIGSNLFYAIYHEEGIDKTWTIKVKNKKVLANKKEGKIFGKQVTHPGLKARHMFRTGLEERADEYQRAMLEEVGKVFERMV